MSNFFIHLIIYLEIYTLANFNAVLSHKCNTHAFLANKMPLVPKANLRALYKVKFISPQGENIVECEEDEYVLDSAEAAGLELPYSCRGGSCSTCTCTLTEGDMSNEDQSYLNDEELKKGYRLICTAYPHSDCTVITHKEEEMHKLREKNDS